MPTVTTGASLATSLRRLAAQSLSAAECRLELASLDLEDERERIGRWLLRGLVAGLLAFLSLQLLVALAVALAWSRGWGIPVIAGFGGASLIATAVAIRALLATPSSRLFESSAQEFARDVAAATGRAP